MKKLIIAAAVGLTLAASMHVSANAGIEAGLGTKESYIDATVLPKLSIGYSRLDRDEYGDQNDIHAHYKLLGDNLQLRAGWRNDMKHQDDSFYGGAEIKTDSFLGFQPYLSYDWGQEFKETNVGVDYNIGMGFGLNLNYHKYDPDHGRDESGLGVGVNYKF